MTVNQRRLHWKIFQATWLGGVAKPNGAADPKAVADPRGSVASADRSYQLCFLGAKDWSHSSVDALSTAKYDIIKRYEKYLIRIWHT